MSKHHDKHHRRASASFVDEDELGEALRRFVTDASPPRRARAPDPAALSIVFVVAMDAVSGVVNNFAALLLVPLNLLELVSTTLRGGLRVEGGAPARFGFFQFLPVGLLGFSIILATGLAFTWSAL
ncbi:MAG: hypothetical protein SFW67_20985 [Myxococcaceae bacterium]|nr:hypothetical protein [Myxococcaceae bacterium]